MKIDDINKNSIVFFLNILYFQVSKLSSIEFEPETPSLCPFAYFTGDRSTT